MRDEPKLTTVWSKILLSVSVYRTASTPDKIGPYHVSEECCSLCCVPGIGLPDSSSISCAAMHGIYSSLTFLSRAVCVMGNIVPNDAPHVLFLGFLHRWGF